MFAAIWCWYLAICSCDCIDLMLTFDGSWRLFRFFFFCFFKTGCPFHVSCKPSSFMYCQYPGGSVLLTLVFVFLRLHHLSEITPPLRLPQLRSLLSWNPRSEVSLRRLTWTKPERFWLSGKYIFSTPFISTIWAMSSSWFDLFFQYANHHTATFLTSALHSSRKYYHSTLHSRVSHSIWFMTTYSHLHICWFSSDLLFSHFLACPWGKSKKAFLIFFFPEQLSSNQQISKKFLNRLYFHFPWSTEKKSLVEVRFRGSRIFIGQFQRIFFFFFDRFCSQVPRNFCREGDRNEKCKGDIFSRSITPHKWFVFFGFRTCVR